MSRNQLKRLMYGYYYGRKIDRRKVKRILRITNQNCAKHGNPWGPVAAAEKPC